MLTKNPHHQNSTSGDIIAPVSPNSSCYVGDNSVSCTSRLLTALWSMVEVGGGLPHRKWNAASCCLAFLSVSKQAPKITCACGLCPARPPGCSHTLCPPASAAFSQDSTALDILSLLSLSCAQATQSTIPPPPRPCHRDGT